MSAIDTPPDARRSVPRRGVAVLAATLAVVLGSAHLAPPLAAEPARGGVSAQGDSARLSLGDRGASVGAWQRQLNILATQGLSVDGLFGPGTEQSTTNFQRFFALPATGVVDETTRDTMRFLLGLTQRGYSGIADFDGLEVAGFVSAGAYCFDVRAHPAFGLSCSAVAADRVISSQVISMDHPGTGPIAPVMVGTVAPGIASVQVQPVEGPAVEAVVRPVAELARNLWATGVAADDVAVVRALDPSGNEVRRIVVDDSAAFVVLGFGDRGPAVTTWQAELNRAIGAGLAENGVFGFATLQATQNFQRFFGLTADGSVGPTTRDLMTYVLTLQAAPDEGAQPLGDPVGGNSASAGYPGVGDTTAYLRDVRLARQDDFDRIVFEFDGAVPEYRAVFVDPPILESPTGQPIDVSGGAFLELTMAWATGFDLTGPEVIETYPGPERLAVGGTHTVTEVVRNQDFEQFMSWTIGLDEDTEYSVTKLYDPFRLVVDVRIPK